MRQFPKIFRWANECLRLLGAFVSLLLCGQLGLLQLAAVSPDIHACLHDGCAPAPKAPDGGSSSKHENTPPEAHVCAVTLLQQGLTLELAVALPVPQSTVIDELGQPIETQPGSLTGPATRARAPPCV
jgi:hypothetical protein